jgi:hypothetical protein
MISSKVVGMSFRGFTKPKHYYTPTSMLEDNETIRFHIDELQKIMDTETLKFEKYFTAFKAKHSNSEYITKINYFKLLALLCYANKANGVLGHIDELYNYSSIYFGIDKKQYLAISKDMTKTEKQKYSYNLQFMANVLEYENDDDATGVNLHYTDADLDKLISLISKCANVLLTLSTHPSFNFDINCIPQGPVALELKNINTSIFNLPETIRYLYLDFAKECTNTDIIIPVNVETLLMNNFQCFNTGLIPFKVKNIQLVSRYPNQYTNFTSAVETMIIYLVNMSRLVCPPNLVNLHLVIVNYIDLDARIRPFVNQYPETEQVPQFEESFNIVVEFNDTIERFCYNGHICLIPPFTGTKLKTFIYKTNEYYEDFPHPVSRKHYIKKILDYVATLPPTLEELILITSFPLHIDLQEIDYLVEVIGRFPNLNMLAFTASPMQYVFNRIDLVLKDKLATIMPAESLKKLVIIINCDQSLIPDDLEDFVIDQEDSD